MARKEAKSAKVVQAEPVEVEEVKEGGMNVDDGIVLTTSLLLALAIVLIFFAGQPYSS